MNYHELSKFLGKLGIRIFVLSLKGYGIMYFIHERTTAEWRNDLRKFITEANNQEGLLEDDTVYNFLIHKLQEEGYKEIDDIAADVYEGIICDSKKFATIYSAAIKDYPAHKDQKDGFGHYGWDSQL
jgi:hypothetical protein